MTDKRPVEETMDQDLSQFDKEIEDDIRRLKRTSNLLTLLGIMVVVLLIFTFGFTVYYYMIKNQGSIKDPYMSIMYVAENGTTVFSQPDKNSNITGKLPMGSMVFLMEEKGDWGMVEKKSVKGWVEKKHLADKVSWEQKKKEGEKKIEFAGVEWYVDEMNQFTIIGRIHNVSDVPLKDIQIKVFFYEQEEPCCDENGEEFKPVLTRDTWIAQDKPLPPNAEKTFHITGKYEKSFKKIRYEVSTTETE